MTFGWPETAEVERLASGARATARQLRLPFRTKSWRGPIGNWSGAGVGSSIDFQDHRSYVPGDDPRHINWHAYARTDQVTMKLYREEIQPRVDVVLDHSASMVVEPAKAARTVELLYAVVEGAMGAGAGVRVYGVAGDRVTPWSVEDLHRHRLPSCEPEVPGSRLRLDRVPWRTGSLRALLSDLLVTDPPAAALARLTSGKGRAVVLAPTVEAERQPTWLGNVELVDCEGGARRRQWVDAGVLDAYRAAYGRHRQLWSSSCASFGAALAWITVEHPLMASLAREAVPAGAMEWTG